MMRISSFALIICLFGLVSCQQVGKVCILKVNYSPWFLLANSCSKCGGRDATYSMIDCPYSRVDFSANPDGVFQCSTKNLSPSIASVCNHPKEFFLCAQLDGVETWKKFNYTAMTPLKLVRCATGNFNFKMPCVLGNNGYIACKFLPEHNNYVRELTGHELPSTVNFRGDMTSPDFAENGILFPSYLLDSMKCIPEAEKQRSCDFYENCIENTFSCGASGYPMGYGKKYCSKFLQFYNDFPEPAQKWIDLTLVCLKRALKPVAISQKTAYTCDSIKNIAFKSHPQCYVDSGFCELFKPETMGEENICKTLKGLWQVYEIKEFSEVITWQQVLDTLSLCETKGAPIDKVKMADVVVKCGLKAVSDGTKEQVYS